MITVANPILPGCHPDPSICRVGDDYYLVTSTFEYLPGLPVMRSRDLVHWETIGHAIDRAEMLDFAGIRSSGGLYAPTIRHDGERFWIVCTLVDPSDDTRGGNFLITAEDAAGPWSDPIWLDADGIDPSVAFDESGRVWMHGTRLARDPAWRDQTEVWVREYAPAERALVGPEHVIWRGAVNGVVWAEGPHLYRIGSRWYLIAAEGGTEADHAVSVARADAVTGPYEGARTNPVFTHRHLGRGAGVIGAGHADLIQAPDGSWYAVMLAMRAADGHHYPLGRETFLCPVAWEDGWPVFAPGRGRLPDALEIPWADAAAESGTWQPDARLSGAIDARDPRWTSLRVLPAEIATAEADGTWLLPVRTASPADAETVAFLGIRQQHADVDTTARLDVSTLADGETAGLIVRQSERDHAAVQVTKTGDGLLLRAMHRRDDWEAVLAERALADAASVPLAVRARGYAYDLIGDGAVIATVDARELDAAATGGFLGTWFGVFATAHGRGPRGSVRIGAFRYEPPVDAVAVPIT
ncbi:glycoside hydrolase family 43 protein [Microbacterium abyssi]|uniref:glycoside hydrolase family 43 protein n=1 Tax=Microbacterium abyssi TaxID=2782166 RepID=UPI0018898440|nr:glycoside hydrolase family 43 protein [Microbacterium sp. A18JL241]